jgi:hypothetical protein
MESSNKIDDEVKNENAKVIAAYKVSLANIGNSVGSTLVNYAKAQPTISKKQVYLFILKNIESKRVRF